VTPVSNGPLLAPHCGLPRRIAHLQQFCRVVPGTVVIDVDQSPTATTGSGESQLERQHADRRPNAAAGHPRPCGPAHHRDRCDFRPASRPTLNSDAWQRSCKGTWSTLRAKVEDKFDRRLTTRVATSTGRIRSDCQ